ncbi:MAG: 4-hydroxy-3-methylbut-2-enyl diphosphate reductase [Leadbetterella sp.]
MKSFDIPSVFKSGFISKLKEIRRVRDKLKKDFSPSVLKFENSTVLIARHFGFCYGVENAVEIAYKTIEDNPDKQIYFLGEMIHNPIVNADLLDRGVKFLTDNDGNRLVDFDSLMPDKDIVVVPAFGTTIEMQEELNSLGINPYSYDTTCPFVEKVWNRSNQIGERGYTVVVHGKPNHEESRATFSHAKKSGHAIVIKDIWEANLLGEYIRGEKSREFFFEEFSGRFSEGFDPEIHLVKLGVVNQTTMLASETQEIANYIRNVLKDHYRLEEETIGEHFASTRDTLCYATNDNQDATHALLEAEADFAIVVGGYNSSNTSHLVELLEKKFTTYFISSEECIGVDGAIQHFDIHGNKEVVSSLPLGKHKPTWILTCGASCPDAKVELVLRTILNQLERSFSLDGCLENI